MLRWKRLFLDGLVPNISTGTSSQVVTEQDFPGIELRLQLREKPLLSQRLSCCLRCVQKPSFYSAAATFVGGVEIMMIRMGFFKKCKVPWLGLEFSKSFSRVCIHDPNQSN